jgi:hypothetical protein
MQTQIGQDMTEEIFLKAQILESTLVEYGLQK